MAMFLFSKKKLFKVDSFAELKYFLIFYDVCYNVKSFWKVDNRNEVGLNKLRSFFLVAVLRCYLYVPLKMLSIKSLKKGIVDAYGHAILGK